MIPPNDRCALDCRAGPVCYRRAVARLAVPFCGSVPKRGSWSLVAELSWCGIPLRSTHSSERNATKRNRPFADFHNRYTVRFATSRRPQTASRRAIGMDLSRRKQRPKRTRRAVRRRHQDRRGRILEAGSGARGIALIWGAGLLRCRAVDFESREVSSLKMVEG
jgi:hypothetical protein